MTKYKATWSNKIETVEIERETKNFVVIKNRHGRESREAKSSEWASYFDSWDEAKDHLVTRAERAVEYAKENLEQKKVILGLVKGLRP